METQKLTELLFSLNTFLFSVSSVPLCSLC